jgi:hypothetical protein
MRKLKYRPWYRYENVKTVPGIDAEMKIPSLGRYGNVNTVPGIDAEMKILSKGYIRKWKYRLRPWVDKEIKLPSLGRRCNENTSSLCFAVSPFVPWVMSMKINNYFWWVHGRATFQQL